MKTIFKTGLTALLMLYSHTCISLPEPYNSVELLPFDSHGWFNGAHQIEQLIEGKEIETVIEIGAWLGSSTRFLANRVTPTGKVYTIDTWLGANEGAQQEDPRLPYLYEQFLSNVIHTNLCDKIIPLRMRSIDAEKELKVQADLIHLDGAHDYDSVKEDILAWYPHLKEGGIMCGDDWHWDTIKRAVRECSEFFNVTYHYEGNYWWYE